MPLKMNIKDYVAHGKLQDTFGIYKETRRTILIHHNNKKINF